MTWFKHKNNIKRYTVMCLLNYPVPPEITMILVFCLSVFDHVACRILFPHQGSNPGPLRWKHRVLTTGQAGNSLCVILKLFHAFSADKRTSLVAQTVKHLPTMQETQVQSLGWEDLLEKEVATHSSIFAWRIPWTEEPDRLQSMGSQRVRRDSATSLLADQKTYMNFFYLWDPPYYVP